MLTSQEAQGGACRPKGFGQPSLAELRRHLANPSSLNDGHRQRLLELASRVASVQALGGEFVRVSLSEQAKAALGGCVALA